MSLEGDIFMINLMVINARKGGLTQVGKSIWPLIVSRAGISVRSLLRDLRAYSGRHKK